MNGLVDECEFDTEVLDAIRDKEAEVLPVRLGTEELEGDIEAAQRAEMIRHGNAAGKPRMATPAATFEYFKARFESLAKTAVA